MNGKRLWFAAAVLLLALLCAGSAFAADTLKFQMELSSNRFTEPKTIYVSVTITNTSDRELPGPVTLYDLDGNRIEEFGEPVLASGASKNWSGPLTVTQKELDAGRIVLHSAS